MAAGYDEMMVESINIPDRLVGFIIGRKGEQINRLQDESGCKIQIARDNGSGNASERICTLTGHPSAIELAKSLIYEIISRKS